MKIRTVRNDGVVLVPENLSECGVMQWLWKRFDGPVTLIFDTLTISEEEHEGIFTPMPAFWINGKRSGHEDTE